MAGKRIHSLVSGEEVRLEHKGRFGTGHRIHHKVSRLYTLPNPINHTDAYTVLVATKKCIRTVWHRILANNNEHDLQNANFHFHRVPKLKSMEGVCPPCCLCNAHKPPFQGDFSRAKQVKDIVYLDIRVPLVPSYSDGFQYRVEVLDDYSRYAILWIIDAQI